MMCPKGQHHACSTRLHGTRRRWWCRALRSRRSERPRLAPRVAGPGLSASCCPGRDAAQHAPLPCRRFESHGQRLPTALQAWNTTHAASRAAPRATATRRRASRHWQQPARRSPSSRPQPAEPHSPERRLQQCCEVRAVRTACLQRLHSTGRRPPRHQMARRAGRNRRAWAATEAQGPPRKQSPPREAPLDEAARACQAEAATAGCHGPTARPIRQSDSRTTRPNGAARLQAQAVGWAPAC